MKIQLYNVYQNVNRLKVKHITQGLFFHEKLQICLRNVLFIKKGLRNVPFL